LFKKAIRKIKEVMKMKSFLNRFRWWQKYIEKTKTWFKKTKMMMISIWEMVGGKSQHSAPFLST
jgi:hypothetical protein